MPTNARVNVPMRETASPSASVTASTMAPRTSGVSRPIAVAAVRVTTAAIAEIRWGPINRSAARRACFGVAVGSSSFTARSPDRRYRAARGCWSEVLWRVPRVPRRSREQCALR